MSPLLSVTERARLEADYPRLGADVRYRKIAALTASDVARAMIAIRPPRGRE